MAFLQFRGGLCLLMLTTACAGPGASPGVASGDSRVFDPVVTPAVVAAACRERLVAERRQPSDDGGARRYRFEHQFPGRRPDEHHVVDVSVAPAGRLLDVARYNERLAAFRRAYADRGPDYLKSQFPEIGRRAQLEILGVGPGGASSAVTFTTADERFDVRVVVSMLLPDGVKGPDCGVDSVARAIATRYDEARR
jgi:hypothetical protein